ncbi:MAG: hypothetical protein Q7U82_01810, partial [Gammaproteobacteria bacterium]|nr:hypothetical protein [Gammaproteobacteria bacterium]
MSKRVNKRSNSRLAAPDTRFARAVVHDIKFPGNYMYKFWITAVMVYSSLCLISTQATAANVFSYAQIDVPFDVRVDGTWVKVIESREAWDAFYRENAGKYLAPESELNIPPQFDFDAYTVIAGGLGAGSAGRSLMIEYVKGGG